MNRTPSVSRSAFTLVELLTVITIIAILMAMLFPFILGAKETARRQQALQDTRAIVHAVEQYNVEYSSYPKFSTGASGGANAADDGVGDTAASMANHNNVLFNILRDIDRTPNTDHAQNPRRVSFMDGKAVSSPDKPKSGFLEVASGTGTQGAFYDPWGIEYNIVIDTNSDNVIDADKYYDDFKAPNQPRVTCGAFSLGKDKTLGTKGDKLYKKGSDYADDLLSWSNH